MTQATAYIRILKDNPLESNEAKALMKRNGYTEKQIRRAREKLTVVAIRTGNKKDVKSFWSLPQADGPYAAFPPLVPSENHSCPSLGVGTSEEKGHECEKSTGDAPMPSFAEDDAEEV